MTHYVSVNTLVLNLRPTKPMLKLKALRLLVFEIDIIITLEMTATFLNGRHFFKRFPMAGTMAWRVQWHGGYNGMMYSVELFLNSRRHKAYTYSQN